MSLVKNYLLKVITENEDNFKRSYNVPFNRIGYLLSNLSDDVKVKETDKFIYGYYEGSDQAIFKYNIRLQMMNSDYTFLELTNM